MRVERLDECTTRGESEMEREGGEGERERALQVGAGVKPGLEAEQAKQRQAGESSAYSSPRRTLDGCLELSLESLPSSSAILDVGSAERSFLSTFCPLGSETHHIN